jgi:hypothetical protein
MRPWWLGPQSLDILFHGRGIAVEYQGAQHSHPVEFFGGTVAFQKQQERDATKRRLCAQNGVLLFEVHPDYVLEDVIAQIRRALDTCSKSVPSDGESQLTSEQDFIP